MPSPPRAASFDWPALDDALDARGVAVVENVLTLPECQALAALYPQSEPFRKRVVMGNHGYGRGEYQYFAYPLPPLVQALRAALYPPLAKVANRWNERLNVATRYPDTHAAFLAECHAVQQNRPTPLLLRYGVGDFNRLHQDLYGAISFPLQVVCLLSAPGTDFTGGELVLTEQRARMQSRVEVVPLGQGSAAIFAVNRRPAASSATPGSDPRYHRVTMRHGVSRLRGGQRLTAGIIFHDAE